jgi:hypothetical protein
VHGYSSVAFIVCCVDSSISGDISLVKSSPLGCVDVILCDLKSSALILPAKSGLLRHINQYFTL